MATGALVEEVAEEVALNLEEVAQVTRKINAQGVGFFIGGLATGVAVGFYFGYRWNREKIRAQAFKESELEVSQIREVYAARAVANLPKPTVEEVIEARGYSTLEPAVEEPARPLPAPVPIVQYSAPAIREMTTEEVAQVEEPQRLNYGKWDYPKELEKRTATEPYVIHQDEFRATESGYDQVSYTYYAADDVMVDDANNQPLLHGDQIVGPDNLKFGYGTDDVDIVYIRNDRLEIEAEISRSPGSYEEDVMGLDRNDAS